MADKNAIELALDKNENLKEKVRWKDTKIKLLLNIIKEQEEYINTLENP